MARKHLAHALWPAITLGAILLCVSEAAHAEETPSDRRGLRFVRLHCAECHAIDDVSASPLSNAPPFRTLHLKYGVADLQRPLAEGVHPTMPLFRLTPGEIADVMAFFKTLH
jgi:cytochrome c